MTRLRVLMLGTFKPEYSRNHVIRVGLERAGVEVLSQPFPPGTPALRRMRGVIAHFPRDRHVDLVLVPMSNQLVAPVYWLMGKLYRQPILLDYFLGLTDLAQDRGGASAPRLAFYRALDRFNIARLDSMTDTAAHRAAFEELVGISPRRMGVIPVGINDDLFQYQPLTSPAQGVTVQFVGTFIPFQGVDVILRAAALLKPDADIRFEIIGDGQTYSAARKLAEELELSNVEFQPFVPYDQLAARMRRSTIQLGVFGDSFKTRYVVPNKVYEGLALGLPLITAESPALAEFFTPGEHLLTVPPGDPEQLAGAIKQLAGSASERERLGRAAAARIREAFLPEQIGLQLKNMIEPLLAR